MIDTGGYLVDDTLNSNYTQIVDCKTEDFSIGARTKAEFDLTYKNILIKVNININKKIAFCINLIV
ncbi:MAG: hypothetical protein ACI4JE_02050 [Ruminococcus sp.]|nr:hypothetical protein [Oscillospiraceae bacterium]